MNLERSILILEVLIIILGSLVMGCAIKELYATNTNDETSDILLTSWIPEKRDGKYYWPSNTPLGFDMWIPNVIDLKEEEGTTPVKIIESEEKTGLWIICADDYFGDEQYPICSFQTRKSRRKEWEDIQRVDY